MNATAHNTATPPSEEELHEAYRRSRLVTLGITFAEAAADPILRRSLNGMVNSDRRWAASTLGYGSSYLERTQGDKA